MLRYAQHDMVLGYFKISASLTDLPQQDAIHSPKLSSWFETWLSHVLALQLKPAPHFLRLCGFA